MTKFRTNQNAGDHALIKQMFPGITETGADDYLAKTTDILKLINETAPSSGTGSPEGVVSANLSQLYIDTAVPQQYWNPNYGAKTGWVAL